MPATIILFLTITFILFLSFLKIFTEKNIDNISLFDRAFWGSIFFFLISQLVDIQYFDGKLSILMWILLAGLKNIIEDKTRKELNSLN